VKVRLFSNLQDVLLLSFQKDNIELLNFPLDVLYELNLRSLLDGFGVEVLLAV